MMMVTLTPMFFGLAEDTRQERIRTTVMRCAATTPPHSSTDSLESGRATSYSATRTMLLTSCRFGETSASCMAEFSLMQSDHRTVSLPASTRALLSPPIAARGVIWLDVDIQCVRPPNESTGHSKIDWAPVQPLALHPFPFQ
ncbi:hypothetical protein IG631_11440 [Alternaria alternata]|nr:hypothetical protein IG631_11440 [Alternaria alternata]